MAEEKKIVVVKGVGTSEHRLGNVIFLGTILDSVKEHEPTAGPDTKVGTDGEDMSACKDGAYWVQVYGKQSMLYLWTADDTRYGYVVAWGDSESNKTADAARRQAMFGHIKIPPIHLAQGDDAEFPWMYTYFHGAICKHVALNAPDHRDRPDLVGSPNLSISALEEYIPDGTGILGVNVYGIPCRMYLWQVGGLRRGLIVSDILDEDLQHAQKMFATRAKDI